MYQQVEFIPENDELKPLCDVYLSYDEKPGIQGIENTADDLLPVPGKHSTVGRDPEYKRHGTLKKAHLDALERASHRVWKTFFTYAAY